MAKISREKGELRTLANQAKMRLKIGYWEQVKKDREQAKAEAASEGICADVVDNYYRNKISKEIKKKEHSNPDEELYKRVCEILDDNEDIINPIGKLIDTQKYNDMDSRTRQRYVMMLAAKYQELSERYYNEKRCKIN